MSALRLVTPSYRHVLGSSLYMCISRFIILHNNYSATRSVSRGEVASRRTMVLEERKNSLAEPRVCAVFFFFLSFLFLFLFRGAHLETRPQILISTTFPIKRRMASRMLIRSSQKNMFTSYRSTLSPPGRDRKKKRERERERSPISFEIDRARKSRCASKISLASRFSVRQRRRQDYRLEDSLEARKKKTDRTIPSATRDAKIAMVQRRRIAGCESTRLSRTRAHRCNCEKRAGTGFRSACCLLLLSFRVTGARSLEFRACPPALSRDRPRREEFHERVRATFERRPLRLSFSRASVRAREREGGGIARSSLFFRGFLASLLSLSLFLLYRSTETTLAVTRVRVCGPDN